PFLGRHLQFLILVSHGEDEPAFFWRTWCEHGASLAAGTDEIGRVEAQMALLFFFSVAGITILGEYRAHLALEELNVRRTRLGCALAVASCSQNEQKKREPWLRASPAQSM